MCHTGVTKHCHIVAWSQGRRSSSDACWGKSREGEHLGTGRGKKLYPCGTRAESRVETYMDLDNWRREASTTRRGRMKCAFRGQEFQEAGQLLFPWSMPLWKRGLCLKEINQSPSPQLTPIPFLLAANHPRSQSQLGFISLMGFWTSW